MEKQLSFQKAQQLLSEGDEHSLRHAALELRRCLEAVVYEKLWAYKDRIPADVARKWQPPQAFKALLVLEPDASKTSEFRFAREETFGVASSGPYQSLGTDHRPESGWLTRTYNKLGSHLHATWPFARNTYPQTIESTRDYLLKVINELEPFVTNTFTVTFAMTTKFSCTECNTTIEANAEVLADVGEIECLNPDCGCRYLVSRDGDTFLFKLDATYLDCAQCRASIRIPCHRLKLNFEFACPSCSARYKISTQHWGVTPLDSQKPGSPQDKQS